MSSSSVIPGVVSERYSVKKLSESEFTISITDVTFGDAGNYTCYEYAHRVTERKVELTVLGEKNVGILILPLGRRYRCLFLQGATICSITTAGSLSVISRSAQNNTKKI